VWTREKEIGPITNFYVTPTGRAEFLIGKQLVYIGITLMNFAILTALVVLVLGVRFVANRWSCFWRHCLCYCGDRVWVDGVDDVIDPGYRSLCQYCLVGHADPAVFGNADAGVIA